MGIFISFMVIVSALVGGIDTVEQGRSAEVVADNTVTSTVVVDSESITAYVG